MKSKIQPGLAGWLALLALMALVLAACGADSASLPAEQADAPPASDIVTIPMPELGFEPGDPELKATNPKVFTKAAGKPQMIELFAFW